MYVQTNVAALFAQTSISRTTLSREVSFERLASGYRINSSADDAAGLGISKNFEAQIASLGTAERNANDAISMAQTADGAGEQVHELLTRLRELAVQAQNGSLSSNDVTNVNTEFQGIMSEIDRSANAALFNSKNLLAGAATSVSFQVGIGTTTNDTILVSFGNVDTTHLGIAGADVTTSGNAQTAISAIDNAIQQLSTTRAGWGTAINRLQATVGNLQTTATNLSASLSRIKDADIALESSNLAREQTLAQVGAAVLTQANQAPQLALQLLQQH